MENKVIEIEEKELEEIIKESVKQAMEKAFDQMTAIMEPTEEKEEVVLEVYDRDKLLTSSFKIPNMEDIEDMDIGSFYASDGEEKDFDAAIVKNNDNYVLELNGCTEDMISCIGMTLSLEQAEDLLDYMQDACSVLAKHTIIKNPGNPFNYDLTIRNENGYCLGVKHPKSIHDFGVTLCVRDDTGYFLGYVKVIGDLDYQRIYDILKGITVGSYGLNDRKYSLRFTNSEHTKTITFEHKEFSVVFKLDDKMAGKLLEAIK